VAWTLASTLAAIVVAGLIWATVGWVRAPVLSERDTVVLADVINSTGDAAFDQTLRLALAVHLGQAPFLRILPESRMRGALPLMGKPPETPVTGPIALEVCRREGAAVLLAGSIAKVGSHYAVGLEAIGCATGESIARQLQEVGSKDEVLSALGTAAGRLRRTLGESRASLAEHDVPIVQATTSSLEALKALSLGDIARDHARQAEALMHYRRATELDPKFAAAWARRGAAAHNVGQTVGDERSGETDETRLAFRTAYELRERVSEAERYYILGHYYRFVAGDPLKAIDTYETWRRLYPNAAVPWTNLASIRINTLGQYEAALPDALGAVRLMPSSSIANTMLVAAYLGTNRLADARQAVSDAASHGASDLSLHRLAFEIALAGDDAGAMEEQVRWAAGDPSAVMVMTEYRALAAASRGRLHEARRLYAQADDLAGQVGTTPVRAGVLLRQAEMEALLGEPRRARLAAEAALDLDGQLMTQLAAASVFALAGDPGRATALLQAVSSRRGESGTSTNAVWQPVVRALLEDRAGRPAQGLQALRPAEMFERGRNFALVPLGVRASLELSAGRAQDAVAAYRDLLSLRPVTPASPWLTVGRLGLARALRQTEDVAGSRAAYDALIEWMKDADPDAAALVAARRERGELR
jgi:tetratricopeptide (TPR) repeat protein